MLNDGPHQQDTIFASTPIIQNMQSPENKAQGQSISKKTILFQGKGRKAELGQLFKTIRKQFERKRISPDGNEMYPPQVIDTLIELIDCSAQESVGRLWQASLELSGKVFTQKQAQLFTSKIDIMWQKGLLEAESMQSAIKIIAFWTSRANTLELDHSPLVQLLVSLVCLKNGQKLNNYAIYSLVNLSNSPEVVRLEIELGIISRITESGRFRLQEQHILYFFKRLLTFLPITFQLNEASVRDLITLLKETWKYDHLDNQNRTIVIQRLMVLNNGSLKNLVTGQFSEQIDLIVRDLELQAKVSNCISIFQLLSSLFAEPHQEGSIIFHQPFMGRVWRIIQQYLTQFQAIVSTKEVNDDELKRQLWSLIQQFLRMNFKGKSQVISWFYSHCLEQIEYEWKERTIGLLCPLLDAKSLLVLVRSNLSEVQYIDQLTLLMVTSLNTSICNDSRLQFTHQLNEQFINTLKGLEYDDRQEIAFGARCLVETINKRQNHQQSPSLRRSPPKEQSKSSFWGSRKKIKLYECDR